MCANSRGFSARGSAASAWRASGRSRLLQPRQSHAGQENSQSQEAKASQKAEELALWQELVPALPEGARLLWRILDNLGQFKRVLAEFGGLSLRIPAALPPANHPLRRRLGAGCLAKLVAALGGTELYVPSCQGVLCRLRQREIISAFSRAASKGQSSVSAVAMLAGRYGLSDRRIWQILKTSPQVPKGAEALRCLAEDHASQA